MKNCVCACVALAAGTTLAGGVAITVDPADVKAEVSPNIYGLGMEDVNHEIYGGLDAQRLYGESFEEASRPWSGTVWIDDAYLADEPTNAYGRIGCREDVVAGLEAAGVNFLRWGGTMCNAEDYNLKTFDGQRKPYRGFWHPVSSGGFGPREFVRLAAAMTVPCAVSISAREDVAGAAKPVEIARKDGAKATLVRAVSLVGAEGLEATNTPDAPEHVKPVDVTEEARKGLVLKPYSYTVVTLATP